ncbi:MAG: lysozyme inhibitor LprI family protein [Telluria sp.]
MKKILFFLSLFFCGLSHGASFNCNSAVTSTEKIICSDAQLSRMDDQLARAYKTVFTTLDGNNKKYLIAEQKSWLKNSRNLCDDLSCLLRSYETRIKLVQECNSMCTNLSESYSLNGEKYNLITIRDANSNNLSFSKDLISRHRGPISGCETLVDIAVGTAHGNHSFGGICKLKTETGFFLVCNDEMIGHFNIVKVSGEATRYGLADFTIKSCFGG